MGFLCNSSQFVESARFHTVQATKSHLQPSLLLLGHALGLTISIYRFMRTHLSPEQPSMLNCLNKLYTSQWDSMSFEEHLAWTCPAVDYLSPLSGPCGLISKYLHWLFLCLECQPSLWVNFDSSFNTTQLSPPRTAHSHHSTRRRPSLLSESPPLLSPPQHEPTLSWHLPCWCCFCWLTQPCLLHWTGISFKAGTISSFSIGAVSDKQKSSSN